MDNTSGACFLRQTAGVSVHGTRGPVVRATTCYVIVRGSLKEVHCSSPSRRSFGVVVEAIMLCKAKRHNQLTLQYRLLALHGRLVC